MLIIKDTHNKNNVSEKLFYLRGLWYYSASKFAVPNNVYNFLSSIDIDDVSSINRVIHVVSEKEYLDQRYRIFDKKEIPIMFSNKNHYLKLKLIQS